MVRLHLTLGQRSAQTNRRVKEPVRQPGDDRQWTRHNLKLLSGLLYTTWQSKFSWRDLEKQMSLNNYHNKQR